MIRIGVAVIAAGLIALALVRLEGARAGLEIEHLRVGNTPVTLYRAPDAEGPAVVVAHGFAGSRQLMEAYSLTLAHAGYQIVAFDFEGHGRHPQPMRGDVTSVGGTTQLLVDQTRRVMDYAAALPGAGDAPLGLLGHSMASDIVIRSALADPRTGPVVAISAFSQAVTADRPRDLLLITGAWEPPLREAALGYLRQVDPGAAEGDLATGPDGLRRQAVVAPSVEHVGVLYSPAGLAAARGWFDAFYGSDGKAPAEATSEAVAGVAADDAARVPSDGQAEVRSRGKADVRSGGQADGPSGSEANVPFASEANVPSHGAAGSGSGAVVASPSPDGAAGSALAVAQPDRPVAATGGWIVLLLAGCVVLAWPLSALLPRGDAPEPVERRRFLAAIVTPALATPVILWAVDSFVISTRFLPVLVADYLALHLGLYGLISLAILRRGGVWFNGVAPLAALALLAYGLGVFGLALDRYAASFVPHTGRLVLIAAIALGAVPFMAADALSLQAGDAPLWRRWLARLTFLLSLALAVALDFERLFFLVMILPVIVLFFAVFGTMGMWAGRRTGQPLVPGLALGLILAWALAVTFPLFAA